MRVVVSSFEANWWVVRVVVLVLSGAVSAIGVLHWKGAGRSAPHRASRFRLAATVALGASSMTLLSYLLVEWTLIDKRGFAWPKMERNHMPSLSDLQSEIGIVLASFLSIVGIVWSAYLVNRLWRASH